MFEDNLDLKHLHCIRKIIYLIVLQDNCSHGDALKEAISCKQDFLINFNKMLICLSYQHW